MTTILADYFADSSVSTSDLERAGFAGVIRYVSAGSESKHMTDSYAKSLHDDGLVIGVVSEGLAERAKEGSAAGTADAAAAAAWADAAGYPKVCPIFYAVDFDGTWTEVKDYFEAIKVDSDATGRAWGIYGGINVIAGAHAAHPHAYLWQTVAWSDGKVADGVHVYQTLPNPSLPAVNIDKVLSTLPLWGKSGVVDVTPHKTKPRKVKKYPLALVTRGAYALIERRLPRRIAAKHALTASDSARTARLRALLAEAEAVPTKT